MSHHKMQLQMVQIWILRIKFSSFSMMCKVQNISRNLHLKDDLQHTFRHKNVIEPERLVVSRDVHMPIIEESQSENDGEIKEQIEALEL